MAGWGRKVGLEREKLSLSPPHPFSSGRGGKGRDGMGRELSLTPACPPPLFWSWKDGMGTLEGPGL